MTASWPSRPRQIFQTTPLRDAVNREALANSRQHPEEELFKNSVVDDYTGSPSEELRWRHMGLVAHDRFFKQLLFGMLPAVGKLAPLYSMCTIEAILTREGSLPTAGSIPKRSCLKNLSRMTTLASRQRSSSSGILD